MPSEAGKDLIATKESEIAESLYEAAQKAATPEEKERLLAEAVAMANKAIKDNPQDATSHYILAQDAIGRKDYDNAMSHLKSAIQNDPENAIYYYDLGKVQYSIKKYGEAAASFNSCCQKNSNYAPARYNLGLCQLKLKNDKAALEAFRKAIDIDPRHEKAHLEEARILSRRGDYPGSIAAYEKVLSRIPDVYQSRQRDGYGSRCNRRRYVHQNCQQPDKRYSHAFYQFVNRENELCQYVLRA